MKKIFIRMAFLVFVLLLNGCSKESQGNGEIYFGETDQWIVIGTIENTFKFTYKGNVDDLVASNPDNKITFSYGTSQGSTVMTEALTSTSFYEVEFTGNYMKDAASNNTVKVHIDYGKTSDSIELHEYTPS